VLGAIIQASSDIARVARPSWVAIALALNALAVSAAALSVSGAAGIAVGSSPSVLARALAVEALTMARASVAFLVLLALTMAVLLSTVVTSVLLVADALHLVSNRDAHSVTRAR